MKRLKSENVDISFISQPKLISPKKFGKSNEKTSVINGWDIKAWSIA